MKRQAKAKSRPLAGIRSAYVRTIYGMVTGWAVAAITSDSSINIAVLRALNLSFTHAQHSASGGADDISNSE
jgi:hypothetical protein